MKSIYLSLMEDLPWTSGPTASTYIKEGAGVLQDELTGVWLVLAIVHINVELIGLKATEQEDV